MATIKGEAAGDREPMTMQHISAAQEARMRVQPSARRETESKGGFVLPFKQVVITAKPPPQPKISLNQS